MAAAPTSVAIDCPRCGVECELPLRVKGRIDKTGPTRGTLHLQLLSGELEHVCPDILIEQQQEAERAWH